MNENHVSLEDKGDSFYRLGGIRREEQMQLSPLKEGAFTIIFLLSPSFQTSWCRKSCYPDHGFSGEVGALGCRKAQIMPLLILVQVSTRHGLTTEAASWEVVWHFQEQTAAPAMSEGWVVEIR